ncbi:HAD-IIIC family phosphatase [Paenibacillus camerounensis]|uniref:HAD-IIIC family phosphatase n=1 Tax=Paenibacillus camerounensis TaxID=1243663 RepID=UPI00069483A5|nr:HAD-IIIC family phosphatase [Paenibacillus camerounensis]
MFREYESSNVKFDSHETSNINQLLLRSSTEWSSTYTIKILRNFPFEFIAKSMQYYLNSWNASFNYLYSDYDPSLGVFEIEPEVDVVLIWLDFRMYYKMQPKSFITWLRSRIIAVQACTEKPILINNWFENLDEEIYIGGLSEELLWTRESNFLLQETLQSMFGVFLVDLSLQSVSKEKNLYDLRNDKMTSFPLNSYGTRLLAKYLGLNLFPALLASKIKVLVLDLDDTLYKGTLGEEGTNKLTLSNGHETLQRLLIKLKNNGLILAVCSRNDEADVNALFREREDFPIRIDDFSVVLANWEDKSKNILQIATSVNVDHTAILFVDDNPVELMKVKDKLPGIHVLLADSDGLETKKRLINYPGIYSIQKDELGVKRSEDIKANQVRKIMEETSVNLNEYLKNLNMSIDIYENKVIHSKRFYELSNKTNQFNLTLRRFEIAAVEKLFSADDHIVFTIGLKDCLTDSGIIGTLAASLQKNTATLIEFLISCRAVGREIENVVLYHFIKELHKRRIDNVCFQYQNGPRNQPAIKWLENISGSKKYKNTKELLSVLEPLVLRHPAEVNYYGRDEK